MAKSPARILWKTFTIPKLGNRVEENEDRFQPIDRQKTFYARREFACALADGATQASFSSLWAQLIVEGALMAGYPSGAMVELIATAQERWNDQVSRIPLPWYAEEKAKQGAFCTLAWLGVRFADHSVKSGGTWRIIAVGDSCIIHIREGAPIGIFPRYAAKDFCNHPTLLSSIPARNLEIISHPDRYYSEGTWGEGDEFLLMTDALAHWFINELEKGNTPYIHIRQSFLEGANSQGRFMDWINAMRASRALKNDDTTLLWLRPDDQPLTRSARR